MASHFYIFSWDAGNTGNLSPKHSPKSRKYYANPKPNPKPNIINASAIGAIYVTISITFKISYNHKIVKFPL